MSLKSQDIMLLLKLEATGYKPRSFNMLAVELGIMGICNKLDDYE